jgi:hypothetical protein
MNIEKDVIKSIITIDSIPENILYDIKTVCKLDDKFVNIERSNNAIDLVNAVIGMIKIDKDSIMYTHLLGNISNKEWKILWSILSCMHICHIEDEYTFTCSLDNVITVFNKHGWFEGENDIELFKNLISVTRPDMFDSALEYIKTSCLNISFARNQGKEVVLKNDFLLLIFILIGRYFWCCSSVEISVYWYYKFLNSINETSLIKYTSYTSKYVFELINTLMIIYPDMHRLSYQNGIVTKVLYDKL